MYLNEAQVKNAGGLELVILGSDLGIGGIVRMVVGSRGWQLKNQTLAEGVDMDKE